MNDRLSRYLFAGILLFCALFARASTTLTGTITDSAGNPLNGVLTMRLPVPAQDTCLNTAVAPTTVLFNVVNGSIVGGAPLKDVAACLQPQGLFYIARAYDTTGALQFYGNFVVTGASFNLGAATPTAVTTSNVSYILPIFPNQTNTFTAAQTFTTILSASSPDAGSGFVRMASGDQQCWRNAANTADVCMGYTNVGAADYLSVNGTLFNQGAMFPPTGSSGGITSVAATGGAGPNVQLTAAAGNGLNTNGGNIVLTPGLKNGIGITGSVAIAHGICNAGASNGCGNGLQETRTLSCTTGAGAGSTCNTTVNWAKFFDDANYTAVCTISGGTGAITGTPYVLNTSSKTTSGMVVTIANLTAIASSGLLDCIGAHD